ncbi:MAG: hypothetical protein ACI3YK_01700 [Eubacteriales bacterium]
MSKITFSELSNAQDTRFGKLEAPLKMVMQQESDEMTKQKGYETTLFRQDDSDSFAGTFIVNDGYGMWESGVEGGTASLDYCNNRKIIECNEYQKGVVITKKMLDDKSPHAQNLMANKMNKLFVDSYHKTKNRSMVKALVGGSLQGSDLIDGKYIRFQNGLIDVTTADGQPLFSKYHTAGNKKLHGSFTQSNYFYLGSAASEAALDSTSGSQQIALLLDRLTVAMRNMKDENGEPMEYMADTVIIPGDNFLLENLVRRALGSDKFAGTPLNDISTQYGTKTLIVLPEWTTTGEANRSQLMLMSSEAKDNLHGNQLLERVPMLVKNYEDNDTFNWVWNGYARWGVGFPTYKHICKLVFDTASKLASVATDVTTI